MKVLIPIATQDVLFKREDYLYPKPLIDIDGVPMIVRVVRSLMKIAEVRFVFIVRAEDCQKFGLAEILRLVTDNNCDIIELRAPTMGAACTCLMAIDYIGDEPILIVNGDQIIDADLQGTIVSFGDSGYDAAVVTVESLHPRWSYVRLDEAGDVIEAAEKRPISSTAIAGLYWFARGTDFVAAAMRLVEHNVQVDGAYYIAPTLNELILQGKRVGHQAIPADAYHSFYSPQKVEEYQRVLQSRQAVPKALAAGDRINVVIPMAGRGSRFSRAGYDKPKPFIDVAGQPMIDRVMENIALDQAHYILIAHGEHVAADPASVGRLSSRSNVTVIPTEITTEGTACSVLLARPLIDSDAPLLIANCDQLVDIDLKAFILDAQARGLDGSILCFRDIDRDPKWSFARLGGDGLVVEVKEKVAISDLATVGIYYFASGSNFVGDAIDMIARNDRVNNEFYTCPIYNYAIRRGARIGVYMMPSDAMHGLGTPEDLQRYLSRAHDL